MSKTLKELIKYGFVGVSGLIVDFGVYYLLTSVFNVQYSFSQAIADSTEMLGIKAKDGTSDALVSSLIGNAFGAINNFILNSYFTFKVHDKKLKRFVPYLMLVIAGMILSTMFMTIMLDYMNLDKDLSKIIAIGLVAAIQFVINKLLIFRKSNN